METLLDALLVLYDECCNSTFKKEKTVVEFVEAGKWRREGGLMATVKADVACV